MDDEINHVLVTIFENLLWDRMCGRIYSGKYGIANIGTDQKFELVDLQKLKSGC